MGPIDPCIVSLFPFFEFYVLYHDQSTVSVLSMRPGILPRYRAAYRSMPLTRYPYGGRFR